MPKEQDQLRDQHSYQVYFCICNFKNYHLLNSN